MPYERSVTAKERPQEFRDRQGQIFRRLPEARRMPYRDPQWCANFFRLVSQSSIAIRH